jgi:hypothetical protein
VLENRDSEVYTIRYIASCLTLLLLTLPTPSSAQQSRVSLGLQAGVNVADLAGADNDIAPHDRFGFLGGGFLKVGTSSRISLQLDVLYVQKGGEENSDADPGDRPDQFHVDYLELPLLFKVALSTDGVRPELFLGPSIAFELSCSYDAFPEGSSDAVDCDEAGIQTRSTDLGVVFGGGLDIPLGAGSLIVDGRGIVGLQSIDDSEADLDYRNRILALMVGYRFPL